MLSVAKRILDNIDACGAQSIKLDTQDDRTVLAIFLYKLILVDGRVRDCELWHFRELLRTKLGVYEDDIEMFEEFVIGCIPFATEIIPFAETVQSMSLEKRQALVAMMQEMSICDTELHELEINLIVQTAEFLGVQIPG